MADPKLGMMLLAKHGIKGKDEAPVEDSAPAAPEGLESAMQDLISALDAKDAAAAASAFHNACEICEGSEDEGPEDESSEDETEEAPPEGE